MDASYIVSCVCERDRERVRVGGREKEGEAESIERRENQTAPRKPGDVGHAHFPVLGKQLGNVVLIIHSS